MLIRRVCVLLLCLMPFTSLPFAAAQNQDGDSDGFVSERNSAPPCWTKLPSRPMAHSSRMSRTVNCGEGMTLAQSRQLIAQSG